MSAITLAESDTHIVRGGCPHDSDACATRVTVERGRATRIAGDPDHPFTNGFLCAKVNRYLERTYHRDRLLYPLRRVGRKGTGSFVRVSWDEAIDEIAARLGEIAHSSDGPQAILPYSYAGTMGLVQGASIDRRFSICSARRSSTGRSVPCRDHRDAMTVGANIGADGEGCRRATSFCSGARTRSRRTRISGRSSWRRGRTARGFLASTRSARARMEQCDEWLAIRPGTDAALALAMMHVLFDEGLEDRDYLERYTLGADQLRERVREYPPERVAPITGLPADRIRELGRSSAARSADGHYGLQAVGGSDDRVPASRHRTLARVGGGVHERHLPLQQRRAPASRPLSADRTINMIPTGDALGHCRCKTQPVRAAGGL